MKTAIITGANGFIGSHILYRLLEQGWRVHALGRSTKLAAWKDRVLAAAQEVGNTEELPGELHCHELDLNSPEGKIEPGFQEDACPPETVLFHVAGDTRFTPADPAAQRRVNVQAPLQLAAALRRRMGRLVHISTAYVAGMRNGLVRESELDCGQGFWNPYEKSKLDAELALTELCRSEGIPLAILRPSIIINDRQSGQASTFTHLNALVEVVSRLQEYYGLSDGQVVSRVIRVVADANARPNLAPVDSIVPPLLRIAVSPAAPGKTFHLCHPAPQTTAEVLSLISEAYKVRDQLTLEFVERIPAQMSHTEEMAARSLKAYAPYLNSRLEFDLSNSRSLVPDYDSHFRPIDVDYLHKVIEFQRGKHLGRHRG